MKTKLHSADEIKMFQKLSVDVHVVPVEGAAIAPICGLLLMSRMIMSWGSPLDISTFLIYREGKMKTDILTDFYYTCEGSLERSSKGFKKLCSHKQFL